MRTSRVLPPSAVIGVALLLLFYMGVWGFQIQQKHPGTHSARSLAESYGASASLNPLAATVIVAGFRGFAADLLWLKADEYWHHGQWQRLLPLYHLIVTLQPRYTTAWSIGGWHMAYNLSLQARSDAAQRQYWVQEGIAFLKMGLAQNRDRADLYFDLGWTYFDRNKDYAAALPYLEEAAHKFPQGVTLRVMAHCYENLGRAEDALRVWQVLAGRGDAAAKKFVTRLMDGNNA